MKPVYLFLAVLVLLALACGGTAAPQKVGESTAPTAPPPPPKIEKYQIGDIVQIGSLTLVVNEIREVEPTKMFKTKEGKRFIVLDITFENTGTEARNLSTMLQMNLKDGTGQQYPIDILATTAAEGETPDGEISPGEKIRGQVGYQVPDGATGLEFVFDASIWGTGKVFVGLEK